MIGFWLWNYTWTKLFFWRIVLGTKNLAFDVCWVKAMKIRAAQMPLHPVVPVSRCATSNSKVLRFLGGFSEFRPEDRISGLRFWEVFLSYDRFFTYSFQFIIHCSNTGVLGFFSVTPRNIRMTPQFGHDRFFTNPYQFIIQYSLLKHRGFGRFFSVTPWNIGMIPQFRHDRFFTNPFQFNIQYSLFTHWGFGRVFSVTPRNIRMTPQFGHDRFFTNPFQFIVHYSLFTHLGFGRFSHLLPGNFVSRWMWKGRVNFYPSV